MFVGVAIRISISETIEQVVVKRINMKYFSAPQILKELQAKLNLKTFFNECYVVYLVGIFFGEMLVIEIFSVKIENTQTSMSIMHKYKQDLQ